MTKDRILNICKRIEENKATEEEICALRDAALSAVSETVPTNIEAALAILRRELKLDYNGDNASGVVPLPGWENGYEAGLRTAYRALKTAAPQISGNEGEMAHRAPLSPPAESASLGVNAPGGMVSSVPIDPRGTREGIETEMARCVVGDKYEHALRCIAGMAVLEGIEYLPRSGAVAQRIAQEALGLPLEPVCIEKLL